MLAKVDIYEEIRLEKAEMELIYEEWGRLNNLQRKANKMVDKSIDESYEDIAKQLGCHKYKWDDWNKYYQKHQARLNKLYAVRHWELFGTVQHRVEKVRGIKY